MQFIDLEEQQKIIKNSINKNIEKVLSHGKYIEGPEVEELETKLKNYTKTKFAISCANGTDALKIALMSLGLNKDDEIITTNFTFISTVEVIKLLGLKPILIDIENNTYNIDTTKIEKKINKKTKAIITVSLYGQCADMDEINNIAKKYNLYVIEDAAQSFGAIYKNKKSCNLSLIATTSFFPSKPLGCYGDGGMIFTSNKNIALKLKIIKNHGQTQKYKHDFIGVNSRLDSIQAAILLAKIHIFNKELEQRQEIANIYNKHLKNYVKIHTIKSDRNSVYAYYTIEVENRKEFIKTMNKSKIPVAIYYPIPIHLQKAFKNLNLEKHLFPKSNNASKKVVSIPMHPYLKKEKQQFIIDKIIEFIIKK